MIKAICVGDVAGRIGREMLFKYVDDIKYQKVR